LLDAFAAAGLANLLQSRAFESAAVAIADRGNVFDIRLQFEHIFFIFIRDTTGDSDDHRRRRAGFVGRPFALDQLPTDCAVRMECERLRETDKLSCYPGRAAYLGGSRAKPIKLGRDSGIREGSETSS
jgi:hypothetical protein